MAMSLDEFCDRLAHLRLDRSGGLVKPYKPLLIAAVVILIHKGKQPSRNVFLDGGLRSAFQQLLDVISRTTASGCSFRSRARRMRFARRKTPVLRRRTCYAKFAAPSSTSPCSSA
jgi:hypothetical protein